ncbi:MAG: ATP-binding protein, partial [Solirubrobacteraceae bacterium]
PATADAVPVLRHALAGYASAAGLSGEALDGVRLAVSEAATNVVRHAYRQQPGQIHVSATTMPGELWILIADDGCGFNTPSSDPGLGMGLALITEATGEFTLEERPGGGTEAKMRFPLPGTEGL